MLGVLPLLGEMGVNRLEAERKFVIPAVGVRTRRVPGEALLTFARQMLHYNLIISDLHENW